MSEASRLAEIQDSYFVTAEEFCKDIQQELRLDAARYAINKKAKVKTECQCAGPKCNKRFVKKSYQQAFCKGKCKDQFWNRVRFWNDEFKVEMLMLKIDEINHGDRDCID